MKDMSAVIQPKSDQTNADDFVAGPRTIRITEVRIAPGTEQPVSIYFEGDNGKPWKVCKSMSRVLVMAWGKDANNYVGRSVTLYRDPSVKWAGEAVGGIRISHLSHIEKSFTMALTATRGSRKPYTVNVLAGSQSALDAPTVGEYETCKDSAAFAALEKRRAAVWESLKGPQQKPLKVASDAAKDRLAKTPTQSVAADPTDRPGLDLAKALQDLQKPADRDALDATWSLVVDHFDRASQEVPAAYRAAYQLSQEDFSK